MSTLREKLARTFCHESPNCKRQCSGNCAGIKEFIDSILTLLRVEVEGIECPNLGITYSPAHRSYYRDGFEQARKAVLKELE